MSDAHQEIEVFHDQFFNTSSRMEMAHLCCDDSFKQGSVDFW